MKNDRKIRTKMRELNEASASWLNMVNSANENTATDRKLEAIVELADEIGRLHEERFEHL